MTIYNFGSINIDHFYRVPHLPGPGETLSATGHDSGLGGKGANQSVAAALAGSHVVHIGMVGPDGAGREALAGFGVDVAHVGRAGTITGHANIHVDPTGENMIVVLPGANHEQSFDSVRAALGGVGPGDYLLLQNETTLVREAAEFARANGCFVVYSAAPFDPVAAAAMRPHVDLIAMNAVEARQMSEALGTAVDEISVLNLVVTEGSDGATWYGSETIRQAAFRVDPVDTTGAGDCFIGSLVAGLDQGMSAAKALRFAAAAAAVQVTRHGAARAMPRLEEIERFLSAQ